MTLRDLQSLSERFLSYLSHWASQVRTSIRNGELLKGLKIWGRANWSFALLSSLIASFIYFTIRGNISFNGQRSIPVEVEIIGSDGRQPVAVEPNQIVVTVRGTENDVRKFEASSQTIKLVVSDAEFSSRGSKYDKKISRKNIPGLRELGLSMTDMRPGTVKLFYDPPGEAEFFIDPPKAVGTPNHGEVTSIKFEPQSVVLKGGKNRLNELKDSVRLTLADIDVENVAPGVFVKECDIKLPEPLKFAQFKVQTKVKAKVTISRREREKTFRNLPIRLSAPTGISLPRGYRIEPLQIQAKVSGYDKSMETLSNSLLTAYAVIPSMETLNLSPGATNTLQVKLEVPPDKEIWTVATTPSAVKLILPLPPPPPPATTVAATNAVPVPEPLSPGASTTNSPISKASSAGGEDHRISEDKNDAKGTVKNGEQKEQQ